MPFNIIDLKKLSGPDFKIQKELLEGFSLYQNLIKTLFWICSWENKLWLIYLRY
ncbi:MAG: hypothetical protein CM1200mP23_3060 [Nitrososphaerota archaeon]|nr:MAG: hypothetical protein CM1200mP23_3060 [Nitrososphaerota archaeon]